MSTFKIRNSKGRYSTGGENPEFTSGGKAWASLGHVRAHLTNYEHDNYGRRRRVPEDWEVVEFAEVRVLGRAKDIHRRAP